MIATNPESEILVPDWPLPDGVCALATTRTGGVSAHPFDTLNLATHVGDDPKLVQTNRKVLADLLPDGTKIQWLKQIHGSSVVKAGFDQSPEADACWTDRANMACAVMTADCLPILVAAKDGSCVSAIHAGWRGLVSGVIESAIKALPVLAQELTVWFGPAIGPCHFEVGAEVREQFLAAASAGDVSVTKQAFQQSLTSEAKYFADIYQLAQIRLSGLGINSQFGGGISSCCDPRFYSYRSEGRTGRMATLIWKV